MVVFNIFNNEQPKVNVPGPLGNISKAKMLFTKKM